MPDILIPNVPTETIRKLSVLAAIDGVSRAEYIRRLLRADVADPPPAGAAHVSDEQRQANNAAFRELAEAAAEFYRERHGEPPGVELTPELDSPTE